MKSRDRRHPRGPIARIAAGTLALAATLGLAACGPQAAGSTGADPAASPRAASADRPGDSPDLDAEAAAGKSRGAPRADGKSGGTTKSNVTRAGARLRGMSATTMLGKLTVKGKAPKTGYDRTRWFGAAWSYDFNHNGCRTRDDILKRDMTRVKFGDSGRCTVTAGTLNDPYDGKSDHWHVGKDSVDIDHVVALENAWVSGAQYWKGSQGQTRRKSIANDPLNLIAADARLNRQKSAANAAEWLPKNKRFRCQYVATQISVKFKYRLAVTRAEKSAMQHILRPCAGQKGAKVSRLDIATGASVADGGSSRSGSSRSGSSRSGSGSRGSGSNGRGTTVGGTVHPGAFCKKSQAGARGHSANGTTYRCTASASDSRLRWRR